MFYLFFGVLSGIGYISPVSTRVKWFLEDLRPTGFLGCALEDFQDQKVKAADGYYANNAPQTVYDMLPMHFRPSSTGEVFERSFEPKLPKPEDQAA